MENDLGEQGNLYLSHPEVAQRLLADLTFDVQNGRSTVGPEAEYDIETIRLRKSGIPDQGSHRNGARDK